MAANVLVDAGFVVALLSRRDTHHRWAVERAPQFTPPWITCEAAMSEAFHLLGPRGAPALTALLRRGAVYVGFALARDQEPVLRLMAKYSDVPRRRRRVPRAHDRNSRRCHHPYHRCRLPYLPPSQPTDCALLDATLMRRGGCRPLWGAKRPSIVVQRLRG